MKLDGKMAHANDAKNKCKTNMDVLVTFVYTLVTNSC